MFERDDWTLFRSLETLGQKALSLPSSYSGRMIMFRVRSPVFLRSSW